MIIWDTAGFEKERRSSFEHSIHGPVNLKEEELQMMPGP
jgi:hypothetical protein